MISDVKAVSSLEKVFVDSSIDNLLELNKFSMLKNEKKSFQIAFKATKNERVAISVESPIDDFLNVSVVKNIQSDFPVMKNADDYYIKKEAGLYPDLLCPVDGGCTFETDGACAFWIEISPANDDVLPVGEHKISITLKTDDAECKSEVSVEVIDALLPKQSLIYTNWIHTDCLMTYYNFEAFSDEYWEALRNYLTKASDYGMNCVLTPVFTPPLDTEIGKERPTVQLVKVFKQGENKYAFDLSLLKKWIDISKECGIEYFEISHLFTQWGAKHAPKIMAEENGKEVKIFGWETRASSNKYKQFLSQFATALKGFLKEEKLEKMCLSTFQMSRRSATFCHTKRQVKLHMTFLASIKLWTLCHLILLPRFAIFVIRFLQPILSIISSVSLMTFGLIIVVRSLAKMFQTDFSQTLP